ncbi:glucose-6-phosphate isomerase [Fontisphaera persica]|uniref:glucose-6-phosphate isomerase n=1 Tax=Fontisphaera persica TaxID=2974023 RepID=UPI0024BF7E9B|nr:glucose-6-phosphate isomerase [Fontisphaera persica]WCJ58423.1 glucose-6-phosphate isomerase [Fontisphaera persica]
MNGKQASLWQRFQQYYSEYPELGLAVDLSRMAFSPDFLAKLEPALQRAYQEMQALEQGALANADEQRMVGHYWLRAPHRVPKKHRALAREITQTIADLKAFARDVHEGRVAGERGPFKNLLVIGIGGSALGPQFIAHALGHPLTDKMNVYFFDNTDPDGMDRVMAPLLMELGQTLCLVISKSGGTKETRNGMVEAAAAYARAGLRFGAHAVAITARGLNSQLEKLAQEERWLRIFPMWDWVGGRTSVTSAVGLLPAALQGLDIDALLAGAQACDEVTREPNTARNPAAQLAAMWYYAGQGRGARDMVVLPYKDRLELFSKYLQQLVMESLGKELDRDGRLVCQGLTVYGNKGSTDQHAYVQQLRDGLNNFFVTFIEVLRDRQGESIAVEGSATTGDFLQGFLLGTRQALWENGRESITLTLQEVSPFTVGVLIALFERAVGLYASLINLNAYHQPGVEAGKKAAGQVLALQEKVLQFLGRRPGRPQTLAAIARGLQAEEHIETIFKVCEHLAANPDRGLTKKAGPSLPETAYALAAKNKARKD